MIRSLWSLVANFCRVAWVTCSLKVRMPKEIFHAQLNETELRSLIEQSLRFPLFRLRHPLISFEKAWLSSLLVHDPDCRIYARYEGDDVLVISS